MSMMCRGCGCTNDQSCPGGCSWVSVIPPICSACQPPIGAEDADQDFCPDSKIGQHNLLWLSERTGFCTHCRAPFVAREVA